MAKKRGGLSVTMLLGSFFGAAMVAAAFAYFNYKFSEYKFIDFDRWIFYEKRDLFKPIQKRYLVIFYSSKAGNTRSLLRNATTKYPVIAIDYYQQNFESTPKVRFIRAGTNTTLQFIQRFNIYHTPSIFIIKKVKDGLYKQDSMIRELDTLKKLKTEGL